MDNLTHSLVGALIGQVVNLLALLMNSLDALVRGAQDMLKAYPEAPVLIGLIPIALFWLVRFSAQHREET